MTPSVTSILVQQDGTAVGVLGPLVIATTEGPRSFRPDTTRRAVDQIARLRRTTHQAKLIYVYVAAEGANVPDQESRRIAAEITALVDEAVGIHEGEGFRASVVRAIVTSISLLQSRRASIMRHSVVESAEAASALLHSRFPELGDVHDILDAIEAVRGAARATL
jgi:hypothetical protein